MWSPVRGEDPNILRFRSSLASLLVEEPITTLIIPRTIERVEVNFQQSDIV